MQYLLLIVFAVSLQLGYSDEGTFICKRVESQCENAESNTMGKLRITNTNARRQKVTPKTRGKSNSSKRLVLEERMKDLEERVARLEETNPTFAQDEEDSTMSELKEDTCHVWHRNRCFRFLKRRTGAIGLKEAEKKCNDLGGELGDIFDVVHFRKLEDYLRNIMEKADDMEYFILGMTYDSKKRTVLRRNGTPTNFIRWYSEDIYPTANTEDTRIHFQVNKMESRPSGMYNVSPMTSARSALCQIPRRIYEQGLAEAGGRPD